MLGVKKNIPINPVIVGCRTIPNIPDLTTDILGNSLYNHS